MNEESLFETNLKHMSRFSQKYIPFIQNADCSGYEFCKTDQNETNLRKKVGEEYQYFHSQRGAIQEARQWLQETESLKKVETLYVYGLGLGYLFDVAKNWLNENKNRVIVFLEDDFALIRRFLELPMATEILTHPQVVVQAFQTPKESKTPLIPTELNWICMTFSKTVSAILVLKLYQELRTKESELIKLMLNVRFTEIETDFTENSQDRIEILYTNFYFNLYKITDAYRGQNLKNKFRDIPTIICGAGSSLSKIGSQIHSIKELALIFGAGTGMNVLNKLGTIPHFGGAIDPNEESINRIKTNYAFEVPFFYMNRFEYRALRSIHGPLLFFRTHFNFEAQVWFELELGITDSIAIEARVSTTNYLLNVAEFIGCNPIALAGIDLAYTDKTRYPKEIQAHPLDSETQHHQITDFPLTSGRFIPVKNAEGEEIFSRYDWLTEAESYANFSRQFPQTKLLNLTKGGLPIRELANPAIHEFKEEYLQKKYDLLNYIHAAIQCSGKMPISKKKLDETYDKWKKSLETCVKISEELSENYEKQKLELLKTGVVPPTHLTDEVSDAIIKLSDEPAYNYCLNEMEGLHKKITLRNMHTYKWFPELYSEKELFLKQLEFEDTKAQFLKNAAELHIQIIDKMVRETVENVEADSKPIDKFPGDIYTIENGNYIIHDEELGLAINEPYIEEDFHGPSRFYSEDGKLLAEGWYYNGKRIGKNRQYYSSGALYSLQRFKDGEWDGVQEYYFENGQKKSRISYSSGLLEGKVELFYPNGVLERELNFKNGKLHGFERNWYSNGQIFSESEYDMDKPVNTSKRWFSNGQLEIEKVYHDSREHYDLRRWNSQGMKVHEELYFKELGTELLQDAKERRGALDILKQQLDKMRKRDS